jgi:Ca-activated chloride channel family protein
LLTDGDANTWVDPVLAGLAAKKEWIKIYTIWIWSEKWGLMSYNVWPFKKQVKIPPLNDKSLKEIAKETWGEYFRADNNNTFKAIFDKLSSLEKNDINIEIKKEYSEYYNVFIYSLAILLILFTYLMINNISFRNKN